MPRDDVQLHRSELTPRWLIPGLIVAWVLILALHVASGLLARSFAGAELLGGALRVDTVFENFSLYSEAAVPSWFFTVLLFSCSLLLFGQAAEPEGERHRAVWVALSTVFLVLSLDEAARVHSLVGAVARDITGVDKDALPYLGLTFSVVLVAVASVLLARFVRSLPAQFRGALVGAAALYVAGVLVSQALPAGVFIGAVAKTLQFTGLVLLIQTLLKHQGNTPRPGDPWPPRLFPILFGVTGALFALHFVVFGLRAQLPLPSSESDELPRELLENFDLNSEAAVPSWFATVALFSCALALYNIYRRESRAGSRLRTYWLVMAVVFVCVSADEAVGVHEFLSAATTRALRIDFDLFPFTWVIPFGLATALVAVLFLRFYFALPKRTRIDFALAFTTFLVGAIGFEVLESVSFRFQVPLLFQVLDGCEELLELVGTILFLRALRDYQRVMTRVAEPLPS